MMVVARLEVGFIFHIWQLIGKKLHSNQEVAHHKNHHEQGDIGDIANCLHYNSKKLLKIFPEFCKLEYSDKTEHSQSSQRTRAAALSRLCYYRVRYYDIYGTYNHYKAIEPIIFILQVVPESSGNQFHNQFNAEKCEKSDVNKVHDDIELNTTIMMCEPKNDNVQQDYYNTQGFKGLCSRQII